ATAAARNPRALFAQPASGDVTPDPVTLDASSTMLASRVGSTIWTLSIENETNAAAPVAIARRLASDRSRRMSATKNPNGAYATTLMMASKRVRRAGSGPNRKNGISADGAIQPEKGSRLA